MIRDTNTINRSRILNQLCYEHHFDAYIGLGLGGAALAFGSHGCWFGWFGWFDFVSSGPALSSSLP